MYLDADIRGMGMDYALMAKDFYAMKWLNVNTVRTATNLFPEEFYQWAGKPINYYYLFHTFKQKKSKKKSCV